MAFAYNGEVRLFYETMGESHAPGVLLLSGAGRQSIDYEDAFCSALARRGFKVVRYDQRDTGLSTGFADRPPDAAGVAKALAEGRAVTLPYGVEAMAADALAVLDAAGLRTAHLFARSLGGLAAQLLALDHPERVVSMTLAMAMSRGIGAQMTREHLLKLDAERFDAETFVSRQVETAKALGNPLYFDEEAVRARAARAFQRGIHQGAVARHFMAGLAAPDLRVRLGAIEAPVQIIHGRLDKVIPLSFAEEAAAAIPGARLTILEDMAHEAAPQVWPLWIELFVANAERAVS